MVAYVLPRSAQRYSMSPVSSLSRQLLLFVSLLFSTTVAIKLCHCIGNSRWNFAHTQQRRSIGRKPSDMPQSVSTGACRPEMVLAASLI